MADNRKLGIIGIGPRGLYALENYILELVKNNCLSHIHIYLFEETGHFGNGQVYDVNQPRSNWVNITERALELESRSELKYRSVQIPSFPSYHEWAGRDYSTIPMDQADTFPPRAEIGKYLSQRFASIAAPLLESGMISMITDRVEEVSIVGGDKLSIKTNSKICQNVDEVLLTIGHQPTVLDDQILGWQECTANQGDLTLFKSPYPLSNYLNHNNLTEKSVIGVRGFGLAMIDVVRGIANKFGKFVVTDSKTRSVSYSADQSISDMFIPFSLNGLPPAPKPLTAAIDEWYKPTDDQINKFEQLIGDSDVQKNADSPDFLINAFAPIAAAIYQQLPKTLGNKTYSPLEIKEIVKEWFGNDSYKHALIVPINQSTVETMRAFVGMGVGIDAISLDYCIGQVWRHCQPSIYDKLSYNQCSEEVFTKIIAIDEGTKRYSYGPPVESIQQMIALAEAGVMNLDMVNDPEIEMADEGWNFNSNGKSITVDLMIDSVLDSPKIESVKSTIVTNMLSDDLMEAVHDALGVSTDENGYVISNVDKTHAPIALLGRLAKGTVIGVDAILECFGSRSQHWATESARKHQQWLTNSKLS